MIDMSKFEKVAKSKFIPGLKQLAKDFGNRKIVGSKSEYAYKQEVRELLNDYHMLYNKKEKNEVFSELYSVTSQHICNDTSEGFDKVVKAGVKNQKSKVQIEKKLDELIILLKKHGLNDDDIAFETAKRELAKKLATENTDKFCPKEYSVVEEAIEKQGVISYKNSDNSPFVKAVQVVELTQKFLERRINEFLTHFKLG